MKYIFTFLAFALITSPARAAFITNSPDADSFVRAAATNSNYGLAGALSVSGITATNASGVTNGAFDTFIRFNTAAMVTSLNTAFGPNNWVIGGARMVLAEVGAPAQTIFNRGKGSFEIRWITNNVWTEGSGMPNGPTTDGICYTNETILLNSSADKSLGIFTNAGVNFTNSFQLGLPPAFVSDLTAGGEVDFFLTAADPKLGFTFNSQNFASTPSVRPFLIISAVPRPGITNFSLVTTNVVFIGTNAVAGGTYYVLGSTDMALPLSQWLPVATNVLNASGGFTITVTNAVNGNSLSPQFFILQTQ
jgi:hypothetical protein